MNTTMDRRFFLTLVTGAGAGLMIGCGSEPSADPKIPVPPAPEPLKTAEAPKVPTNTFAPDAWIRVAPNGGVTLIVDKSEMGQGIETALAMLVAEELDVPLSSIKTEFAPQDPIYKNKMFGMQATGGSTSIRGDYLPLRKAAAAARAMLVAAAGDILKVPAAECKTENGEVIHTGSAKKIGYGMLTEAAAKQAMPSDPKLKDSSEFKVIGTSPPRLDAKAKAMGKAEFGLDVRVPGMLTAMIVRPPVIGGKVSKFNAEKASTIKGVRKVFQVPMGVAVVGEHFWAAKTGAEALEVTWDDGPNAKLSNETLRAQAKDLVKKAGVVGESKGDFEKVFKSAKKKLDVVYELPFQAHATMEPPNCTAHVKPDGVELWISTQSQGIVAAAVAGMLKIDPKKVIVHTTYLGGGFGRRSEVDYVLEAVFCSKEMNAPVKVVWTREDDLRHDQYRPASYTVVRAAMDDQGNVQGAAFRAVSGSIMTRLFPQYVKNGVDRSALEGLMKADYDLEHVLVDYHMQNVVPVGFWRSVGHSLNAFVIEGMMDELAVMAKKDPAEFRKPLLAKNPRLLAVLELAAKKADWGKTLPKRQGMGIAVHASFGSYVAQVAQVTVDDKGQVKVDRVVCAVDCGAVVHPSTVEAQIQGAVIFGLGATLKSEIHIENGRVKEGNFHNYKLIEIGETPRIEVHLVPSKEAPGGIGEPGTPPIAPAVVNAIYAATGKRVRKLPVNAAELKA